jgi:hypothetical protein
MAMSWGIGGMLLTGDSATVSTTNIKWTYLELNLAFVVRGQDKYPWLTRIIYK